MIERIEQLCAAFGPAGRETSVRDQIVKALSLIHIWPGQPFTFPYAVLLRIGFAGPQSLPCAGELLPRLSTLTGISGGISLLHFP